MLTARARRTTRLLVVVLAAVMAVSCVNGDSPPPQATPPVYSQALSDGVHEGRWRAITTSNITVQLVRVLSGREAIDAAVQDGHELDDGTLPNDVYVQELNMTVTLPIAGDAGFRIIDCTGACEEVGTTLDALVSREDRPYGGSDAIFELTVEDGTVISLVEVYLP